MKRTLKAVTSRIVEMLSNNETVPEKVKIQDIRVFNETKKVHALGKLILLCHEVKQELVLRADFIKARDTIECVICHKKVMSKDNLNSSGQCNSCIKEIEKVKKEKAQKILLLKNWKQLEKDLKKFNGGYTFLDINIKKIKRAVRLKDKTSIIFRIYRDEIYSGSSWHQRPVSHALRITSDGYKLEAQQLKKDFDGKNVAEGLHNRIEKLVRDYEVDIQKGKSAENKENRFIKAIMKDLGVTEEAIENYYIFPRGRRYDGRISTEIKEVIFQGIKMKASYYSEKVVYHIAGIILRGLTASQVKKIAKLVSTF